MTDADYLERLKILGKLCYIYDTAAASVTTMETAIARFFDQVATGEAATSWAALQVFNPYTAQFASAVASGPTALKAWAVQCAGYYLASAAFTAGLVTARASNTAAASLVAWIADMTDDSKTLTTAASTGLVHFFETNWSPTGDFPQSESPTYADGTYVVATIVA